MLIPVILLISFSYHFFIGISAIRKCFKGSIFRRQDPAMHWYEMRSEIDENGRAELKFYGDKHHVPEDLQFSYSSIPKK
jgi:hypothetical protein